MKDINKRKVKIFQKRNALDLENALNGFFYNKPHIYDVDIQYDMHIAPDGNSLYIAFIRFLE